MPNPVDLPHPTLKKFCLEPFGAIYRQESAHQKGRERFTDSPEGARECLPTHRRRFSTFRLLISKWPQMAFYGFKLPFGVIWSIRSHFPLKQKRSSDCCTISYTVVIEVIWALYGRYNFLRQLLERFSTLLLLISKWPFAGFTLPFGVIQSTWSHFPLKQKLLLQRLLPDMLYGSYRNVIREVARKLQGSCKEVARELQRPPLYIHPYTYYN